MEDIRPSRGHIRFSDFEVDVRAGELRKQGVRVKLQDQPFQILQILLQHPSEIVTREQLRQKIWPADTFVDFDHGLYNAIKRLREALGDSAEKPRFIETLSRRGYRFIGNIEARPGRIQALAVLPLENLSRDPEQEYFADGMTEALINSLAKIGDLRVISRTSAMQYKGVRKPLREIARELEVDAIVEGTVLRSGHRVRITAQLLEASRETHLWAESYERDLRHVLALQSEVARAIAEQVQVKLTPQEQAQFAQVQPVDPEAYEAYLKGRYYWNKRSGDALTKGAECFQQAIAKDPTYAAAYAGLADCASSAGWFGFLSPDEGCGKGKALALKALEIDPGLAEAHASLAWATVHYDYDFLAAEREYKRSLELNPRYATAHQWFGIFLAAVGRFEEAISELKQAVRLDPVSLMSTGSLAWVYLCARRYDQEIEECKKTLDLDRNFYHVRWGLGMGYLQKAMCEQAIVEMREAVKLSQDAPLVVGMLGEAYAAAGHRDEAQKVLEQLKELSKQRYVTPYIVGRIYAALNQVDEALRWLETAYREHAAWMVWLKVDARLDGLRSDPRFQDLLRRMNFPP